MLGVGGITVPKMDAIPSLVDYIVCGEGWYETII